MTAEELLNTVTSMDHPNSKGLSYKDIKDIMIQFAKFHVYEAVKAQIRLENDRVSNESEIDELTKEALDHIYPLEKIQ